MILPSSSHVFRLEHTTILSQQKTVVQSLLNDLKKKPFKSHQTAHIESLNFHGKSHEHPEKTSIQIPTFFRQPLLVAANQWLSVN